MADPNLEMLRRVAKALLALDVTVVFVGGATIALHLDAYASSQLRVTLDVDCVIPTSTLNAYQAVESRLRELGFSHCQDDGSPICRWNFEDLVVDVMPLDSAILGFGSRFARLGFSSAETREIVPGLYVKILSLRFLLASKVEAYEARGAGAPFESKDLEDLVTLLDGANGIVEAVEAQADEVRSHVSNWAARFLVDPRASDLVEGHIPRGPLLTQRVDRVLGRLRQLARLWPH